MAGIPQKVQKEAEEAEKAIQELRDQDSGKTDIVTPSAETESAPTETAPKEAVTAPEETLKPTEDKKPAEVDASLKTENDRLRGEMASIQAELAKVRHQYDVLKGKEYAEVPRLQAENKQLKEENERLKAGKGKADTDKTADEALDDFAMEYGEEASKAINSRIQSLTAPLNAQIEELKGMVSTLTGKPASEVKTAGSPADSTTNLYATALMGLVPDLETIRDNPGFAEFLNNVEPFSNVRYLDLLVDSDKSRDAQGVARIYNAFKKAGPSTTSTTASADASKKDKEKLVTPGSDARSGAGNLDNEKPIFSRKDIEDHYNKARKNPTLQADSQWIAKTKEYDLAVHEGRIVG